MVHLWVFFVLVISYAVFDEEPYTLLITGAEARQSCRVHVCDPVVMSASLSWQ